MVNGTVVGISFDAKAALRAGVEPLDSLTGALEALARFNPGQRPVRRWKQRPPPASRTR